MTQLIEMPEKVLGSIMEHMDFFSIMKLRGTCHNLQNYIDTELPNLGITFISFHSDTNHHEIWLNFSSGAQLHVQYHKHQDGCKIMKNQKEQIVTMDYSTLFYWNLQKILSHQSSILPQLTISCHSVPKELTEILKSLKFPLKVKHFLMKTTHQSQVLEVLPFFDLEEFKEFEIYELRQSSVQELWKFDRLVESEHWKKAQKFSSLGFYVDVSMENFKHFDSSYFMIRSISVEDLDLLKRNFLLSPTFKYCNFGYQYFNNQENLLETFGAPYITEELNKGDQKRWYLKFPDNFVLCILLLPGMVYYTRISEEEVPKGAIVQ